MTLARVQMRRGTAAAWVAADPVLGPGEWGFETDSKLAKIGDGGTAWTLLPYFADITDLVSSVSTADTDLTALTTQVNALGVWQAFTPTLTVFSLSSATYRYCQIGKLVLVHFDGTRTSSDGQPTMTLPVSAISGAVSVMAGSGLYTNGGPETYSWMPVVDPTDQKMYFLNTNVAVPGSAATYTWDSSSGVISGSFAYEAA